MTSTTLEGQHITMTSSAGLRKVLITGAGSGFGREVAMRLADKGFNVIASVEIYAQVQTLKRQAAERGVSLQVEKLDVTNDGDRRKALAWNVEILVNNAGLGEGGSTVDVPAFNIRNEFEVNVTGPLLLTQGIAKQMVKRGAGRIVWVSSREGLNVNPFTGVYSASKHAVEPWRLNSRNLASRSRPLTPCPS
jgi:short-subunit dehydrogenase